MPESDSTPPPSPSAGKAESGAARNLIQAGLSYVEARGQLLQIEAKEAATHVSRTATFGGMAAGALFVAWVLAMPALVSLVAKATESRWEYVALAAAAVHIVLGLLFFIVAKARSRSLRPFEESLNQLREDRAWLAGKHQQK